MITFKWKEVIEYLENNPKERFDWGNPYRTDRKTYMNSCCLMSSFFQAMGVPGFYRVDYSGFEGYSIDNKLVCKIIDPPFEEIETIHWNEYDGRDSTSDILNKWNEWKSKHSKKVIE